MTKIREVEILQAAAVAVAAPRYMGAFASAMGLVLLEHWPWFADVEIITGAAMALLEGWAIAFIFRNWRRLRVGGTHWKVLLTLQIILLLMLPATTAPYLVSSQLAKPVHEILSSPLIWLWSFAVAAIAPLVVAAVGYADVGALQEQTHKVARAPQEQAQVTQERPLELAQVAYLCNGCDREFGTKQALSAHKRFCARMLNVDAGKVTVNGKATGDYLTTNGQ